MKAPKFALNGQHPNLVEPSHANNFVDSGEFLVKGIENPALIK